MKRISSLFVCLAILLTALMGSVTTVSATDGGMKAGTYETVIKGHNGDIAISVTVDDSSIQDVSITAHQETPGIGDNAINSVAAQVKDGQTLNVDMVSGATITSATVLAGITQCLKDAGADVDALRAAPKAYETPVYETEKTADVVIVGGGGAGLAAAVSAVQNGASVIILEKSGAVGGNTLVCGGVYNAPDPALQEPAGIVDSPEFFATQTWEGGDMVGNKDLVDVLCFNAFDGLEWLKSLDVEFMDTIGQAAGALHPRTHDTVLPMGSGIIFGYINFLEGKAETLLDTTATHIIKNEEGRVVAVQATNPDGTELLVNANNGVVLSTGGFGGNVELRTKYNTSGKWNDLGPSVMTTNRATITGDGIEMAEEVGANLIDMEQIQLLHLGHPKTGHMTRYMPRNLSGTDQVIFVNQEGERFVREDGRRDVICNAVLAQTNGMMYIIESADGNFIPLDVATTADGIPASEAEANGDIFVGQTLEELANKIGCDPAALQATVDAFNASVDTGADDYERILFTTKLENGPFVATPRVPAVHHTMGGVEIDTVCRVIGEDGNIMPGFYAAGEITGGIHGANRLGGNAVVDTVVFGKLAGESAAKAQ